MNMVPAWLKSYIKSACYSICDDYGANVDGCMGIGFIPRIMVFLLMR